jgi:dephospho-CoA kinase
MKHYCHGLTGGIGSGKSTVAQLFSELGVRIVDTDLISHQLTQTNGLAIPEIIKTFGAEFVNKDGALDRSKMRELVFTDSDAKRHLEAILHPLILAQAKMLTAHTTDAPYTLVVVPLLFENGRYLDWLQRKIVVDCPESKQIMRTMQRSGLSELAVSSIMEQQVDRSYRIKLADDIIRNDDSLDTLRAQVGQLHSRLISL